MFDIQGFEPIGEDSRNASTTLREPFRESVPEFENPIPEVRESADEVGASMKSAVELAKEFKTSDRSIQNWYGLVATAYSWLPEADLKLGTGKNTRYTSLCIAKMGELKAARDAGLTANDWIARVRQQNEAAIAAYQSKQQRPQPEVTVENPSSPLALFKPEVLALYNQSQQPQNSLPVKAETKLYFTPGDYSNRYQSTEMMVANQAGKEVSFANELLAKFAEMAADNQSWNQAESQKQDVQQRDATLRGMNRALNEFLNENTAYRGLKHQLETGQITPEQVLTMLMQFQGKGQSPDGSSASA